jgi:hypothetical protein
VRQSSRKFSNGPLTGDFVHAQNLEVSLGGFALFDFQIPNLFKAEPDFDDKY